MSTPAAARRRPRHAWLDLRFAVGIALVALSIAGVWLVLAAAKQTTPVLAAARTIVPGQQVEAGDVRVVEVALGAARDAYLGLDALETGAVANRTIDEGELLPRASLDAAHERAVTTLVVRSATALPESVRRGTAVDLWVSPAGDRGEYEHPRVLSSRAVVAGVTEQGGLLTGGGDAVEVVVARADVAAVLDALTNGSAVAVVPAGD